MSAASPRPHNNDLFQELELKIISPRPRVLDLFCGAGGAAFGLMQAGFDTVGIDLRRFHDYPGPVLTFDIAEGLPEDIAKTFDAVWASPPCQRYSSVTPTKSAVRAPDLIDKTRSLCKGFGLPFVIENVPDAPIRPDLFLCGEMFDGLRIIRHRHFEIEGFVVPQPMHPPHWRGRNGYFCVVGNGQQKYGYKGSPHLRYVDQIRDAMGIEHIRAGRQLVQAVPPAYARYIGTHLMQHLRP